MIRVILDLISHARATARVYVVWGRNPGGLRAQSQVLGVRLFHTGAIICSSTPVLVRTGTQSTSTSALEYLDTKFSTKFRQPALSPHGPQSGPLRLRQSGYCVITMYIWIGRNS